MKGFAVIVILVIFYAIFHFCVVSSQSIVTNTFDRNPYPGFDNPNQVNQQHQGHQGPAPQNQQGPAAQGQGGLNASQSYSILDGFGYSDPAIRQYLSIAYGTIMGRPDCVQRSMCYFGNYLHGTPGSSIFLTMASPYIPEAMMPLYNIFQNALEYGQDCSIYSCNPSQTVSVPPHNTGTI